MSGTFDDMGKQMNRKHSRRGVLRLAGAGALGVTAAVALPGIASAGGEFKHTSPLWFVNVNGQNFNVIEPIRVKRGG